MNNKPLPPVTIQNIGHSIFSVSAHIERTLPTVAYFIVDKQIALIDPGPETFAPILEEFFKRCSIDPGKIAYIIPTHIHMDHAGGTGYWVRRLPGIKVLLHPRGARHMVEPAKLIESTKAVFGEAFVQLGGMQPLTPSQIIEVADGQTFFVGSHALKIIYSPGHAPHHNCIYDENIRGLFSGEALGLPVNNTGVVLPAAAPPNFDAELTLETADKLEKLRPDIIFYGHDGWHRDVQPLIQSLKSNTRIFPDLVLKETKAGKSADEIRASMLQLLRKLAGTDLDFDLSMDVAAYTTYFKKKGSL